MNKLSAEQQELLNTTFSPELEKQAAAEAALISDLYTTGFSKLASAACDEMDKEEEKEEEKEEHKKLKPEHEKAASDRGAFIARGYIDGLMKEGAERHGDELHYFYPALEEKIASGKYEHGLSTVEKVQGAVGRGMKGFQENVRKAKSGEKYPNVMERIGNMGHKATGEKRKALEALALKSKLSGKERAIEGGKALAKASPVLGLAGYGGYKAHKSLKKKHEEE